MKLYRGRRFFQVAFFLLFITLLTLTVWPLGNIFLGAFLVADPLITFNSLNRGVFIKEMLLAGIILLSPFFLGRVFCGYVCPLGFTIELLGPKAQVLKKTRAREFLLKLPPFILIVVLIFLLFGNAIPLVFDPLSLITRSLTIAFFPFLDSVVRFIGDVLYVLPPLREFVDSVTSALSGWLLFEKPLSYQLFFTIFTMFLLLVGISYLRRRVWCRDICPLGSLLGFLSRYSLFGRVVDSEKCVKCLKCESVCPLDAIRESGLACDKTRCQLSFECADVCPEQAISFGKYPQKAIYNPSRRAFLATASLTAAGVFFSTKTLRRQKLDARLIRPPGSTRESDFLSLCSRCGQCMKVCPTNVIQPSLWKAGLEGIFTPELDFTHAYCDFNCNECGKVCPTRAIEPISLAKKQKTIIGRAYIDKNRCIPFVDFKNCLVCQELCPTPDKAIILEEREVTTPQGARVKLKYPYVLPKLCIGCGICENKCPVENEAAIIVFAGGMDIKN